jgi:hydroxyethylthiazole kinase-like sugar kinase family protein
MQTWRLAPRLCVIVCVQNPWCIVFDDNSLWLAENGCQCIPKVSGSLCSVAVVMAAGSWQKLISAAEAGGAVGGGLKQLQQS